LIRKATRQPKKDVIEAQQKTPKEEGKKKNFPRGDKKRKIKGSSKKGKKKKIIGHRGTKGEVERGHRTWKGEGGGVRDD